MSGCFRLRLGARRSLRLRCAIRCTAPALHLPLPDRRPKRQADNTFSTVGLFRKCTDYYDIAVARQFADTWTEVVLLAVRVRPFSDV